MEMRRRKGAGKGETVASNGLVLQWQGEVYNTTQDREGPEPSWRQASVRLVNCFEPGSSQTVGGYGVAFLFISDSTGTVWLETADKWLLLRIGSCLPLAHIYLACPTPQSCAYLWLHPGTRGDETDRLNSTEERYPRI